MGLVLAARSINGGLHSFAFPHLHDIHRHIDTRLHPAATLTADVSQRRAIYGIRSTVHTGTRLHCSGGLFPGACW